MEKTLILLKPDAVQRNLSGEIIKILEQTGYKIIGMKFMILPLEKANDHYNEHKDKPFFDELVDIKKFFLYQNMFMFSESFGNHFGAFLERP